MAFSARFRTVPHALTRKRIYALLIVHDAAYSAGVMSTSLPTLLTPHEVAHWLSQPAARVVRLARAGQIPCLKLPDGKLLFDPRELSRWVERLRTGEAANA